jgi:hypothetical protein
MRAMRFSTWMTGALSVVTVFAFTGFMASGCGSTSGPSTQQACSDLAAARCNQRSNCTELADPDGGATASAGASLVRVYGDMHTCLEREELACRNGLSAPQTGNSPAKVEACVKAFATYSCQDFFDNNPPADCAVTGARGNGMTCTFGGQCTSGYCQGAKTSVCGVCADMPMPGADCTDSACGHNQRCVNADNTCEAVVSLNGACDGTHPCDSGLACVGANATTMTMGTCQMGGSAPGVPCGAGQAMTACDNSLALYCAGPTGGKTCMPIVFVGNGMSCGLLADGSRTDCIAGDCYTTTGIATGTTVGTCKSFVPETAACDTVLGPGCLAPARCVVAAGGTTGTCVVPVASMCGG